MKIVLASLVLIGLGVFGVATMACQTAQRSPGVARVRYEVEVDPVRVRAVGWVASDASDAQAVEAAVSVVRRRLEAMGRAVVFSAPEGRRFELQMPQVQPADRELVRQLIEGVGLCEFLTVADATNVQGLGIDLAAEQAKLDAWRKSNPAKPLNAVHDSTVPARLLWVETKFAETKGAPLPLLLPDRLEDTFGAGSLSRTFLSQDSYGYPAIGFELPEARSADFERFTTERVEQRLAIVLDGQIRSAPTLNSKLKSSGIIEGRFKEDEVKRISDGLAQHAGPLKVLEIK